MLSAAFGNQVPDVAGGFTAKAKGIPGPPVSTVDRFPRQSMVYCARTQSTVDECKTCCATQDKNPDLCKLLCILKFAIWGKQEERLEARTSPGPGSSSLGPTPTKPCVVRCRKTPGKADLACIQMCLPGTQSGMSGFGAWYSDVWSTVSGVPGQIPWYVWAGTGLVLGLALFRSRKRRRR